VQSSYDAQSAIRHLGLIGDPFAVPDDGSADSAGLKLAVRAASLKLLAAIEDSVSDPAHTPIIIEKNSQLPAYYPVAALAGALANLSASESVEGVIPAYVPLDMMRMGRVRAVLNVFAERIANGTPDVLIGNLAREALSEPDDSLAEWTMLDETGFDREAALAEIEADAAAFAVRIFGAPLESREGADDFEALMRVSTTRQQRLDADPAGDSTLAESEDATDDPLGEVFTIPLGEIDEDALTEGQPDGSTDALLAEYIAAYAKANLSPVVARGIRAYRAQGCASMAEELKVSKAPTKTLLALLKFASGTYRAGVVIYDRLEMWENVPEDLRASIVETMVALRENLRDSAVLVLMLQAGKAPELESSFESARHITWDFAELDDVYPSDAVFDADIALGWVSAAALGGEIPAWAEEVVSAVPEGTLMGAACAAVSTAVQAAASAGTVPTAAAVVDALARD
jgi:hypothetical protein